MKKRIQYLDSLKGFATLLVAYGHVVNRVVEADSIHASFYKIVSDIIYNFHMPLFIFISGVIFYLAYSKDTPETDKRYKKHLLNMIVLYLFYDIIFALFKVAIGGFSRDVGIADVFLIPIKPVGLLWYLFVLILFYLIFRMKWVRNINQSVALPVLFVLSAVSVFIISWEYLKISNVLFLMLFFYLGILFARYRTDDRKDSSLLTAVYGALAVFSVAVFLAYIFLGKEWLDLPGVKTLTAAGMIVIVVSAFRKIRLLRESKLLSLLGRYSLEIYIIHLYVIEVLWRVFQKLPKVQNDFTLIIIAAVSVAVPIFISVVLKKIKLHSLFFNPVGYFARKEDK